jgi:hypothetical protein
MDVAALRAEVEARFLSRPGHAITGSQLVGTVVLDEFTLVVVVREETGELHRVVNDVRDWSGELLVRDNLGPLQDWMDGVLNYPSFRQYEGRDGWGVHQWSDPLDLD